MKEKMLTEVF
jgi:tetratricopeptide (TPR) repeat protein